MTQAKPAKPKRKRSENLDLQRMRRLYEAMLRCSRATRDAVARARLGTEVPALLELRGGDVLVLSHVSSTMRLLAAAEAQRRAPTARSNGTASALAVQLGLASGIALRARQERRRAIVAVFAEGPDRNAWRDALRLASQGRLPLLFFLLSRSPRLERLVADANAAGVAAMIVDAADSVAIYRVCQEAQLRARMGDGPAFIVGCLPRASARPDPLASLHTFLREHAYPVDEWHEAFSRRARRTAGQRRVGKSRAKASAMELPFHVITLRR